MNTFKQYRALNEAKHIKTYTASGTGYSAKVEPIGDKHSVVKFYQDGKHQKYSDYEDEHEDAHEFAQDEIERKIKEHKSKIQEESVQIDERIDKPQGHENSGDPISDESEKQGRKNKMMGKLSNNTKLEIIAKILAGK